MKNKVHFKSLMRSMLFGAAVVTVSCTFTACDSETGDVAEPMAEFKAEDQNGAIIAGKYIVVYKDGANLRLSEGASYGQR
ncbi:MAG: S8 family peptidase, partial [Pontibacter sp.]|nr:S8 family peptidase [Pontibacter sp.]